MGPPDLAALGRRLRCRGIVFGARGGRLATWLRPEHEGIMAYKMLSSESKCILYAIMPEYTCLNQYSTRYHGQRVIIHW